MTIWSTIRVKTTWNKIKFIQGIRCRKNIFFSVLYSSELQMIRNCASDIRRNFDTSTLWWRLQLSENFWAVFSSTPGHAWLMCTHHWAPEEYDSIWKLAQLSTQSVGYLTAYLEFQSKWWRGRKNTQNKIDSTKWKTNKNKPAIKYIGWESK